MSKLNPGELTLRQAEKAILDILSRVPDGHLPKPDRTEKTTSHHGGHPDKIFWFGSLGHHLRPVTNSTPGQMGRSELRELFAEEWLLRLRCKTFGSRFQFRDGEQVDGAA
jgi:hypothetical protein